jgi:alkylation response protein AidB-like acyl-CoA dehydrogenase
MEEFDEILGAVGAYVREVVVPAEDVIVDTDEIPAAIRRGAAEMGLVGYALPIEYGGHYVISGQKRFITNANWSKGAGRVRLYRRTRGAYGPHGPPRGGQSCRLLKLWGWPDYRGSR